MGTYGQYRIPPGEECVNFGVGQPSPTLLPLSRVRQASASKFAEEDPLFLQYGYISGYPAFRAELARFLTSQYQSFGGPHVDPELLFVTNGVSGALALYCSIFVSRGDVVLVENPSYFLALSIFRDFGLKIVPVPLDKDGLDVTVLETLLSSDPTLRPRFLYTIPAFQNPTGVNMSAARKKALVRIAAKYDFHILADEVYQLLAFDNSGGDVAVSTSSVVVPPSAPLCTFDEGFEGAGHVLSIGSFAKILAPGLRLGWMQTSTAGAKLLAKFYGCGQLDSSGAVNPVISGIVHTFIESGAQVEHLAAVRLELATRARILGDALRVALPEGTTFDQPSGGYFLWIKLPPGLNGASLLELAASEHKVRFQPGSRFGTGLEGYIRLSFSYYPASDLAAGAVRLGSAIRAALLSLHSSSSSSIITSPAAAAAAAAAAVSSSSFTLGVHGATGRLGKLIVAAAASSVGIEEGGITSCLIVPRGGAPSIQDGIDVIIDVSLPAGTAALIASLLARGAPYPALVIGTTGDLPKEALVAYATKAPVATCANFSVGVPLLNAMLRAATGVLPAGWHAAVSEEHHVKKVDSPSGTALTLVKGLQSAGAAPFGGAPGEPVPVSSRRLGDTIGVHTIHLVGPSERLDITHTATGRDVFARGALRIATWLRSQAPGYYVK